jgi:hypothetical protein
MWESCVSSPSSAVTAMVLPVLKARECGGVSDKTPMLGKRYMRRFRLAAAAVLDRSRIDGISVERQHPGLSIRDVGQ